MATSKSCSLFLLVSATSALLLSSAIVDAVCVARKPLSLEAVAHKELPITPASFQKQSSVPQVSLFASNAVKGVGLNHLDKVDHTVVDICHQTDYPDVCIPTVSAHLKGTANPLSMLTAEIEACTEKTKSAAAEVAKIAADPSTSSAEKMALSTCKENYNSALDSLSKAEKAAAAHDVGTLNSELSAVITYASTCDDSFIELSLKSPVEGADRILQKLGSNCLAIAAQVHF
ncbi:probable pectinesterase/pectinesterase inhibitor 13 [Rhodamnia argentea]|uniref:Probable pectinesterase/pectinesterase inhibitor 13 n=1 Tax=Rhodamnia argentea TaxID=178133 RepID=A0A8B8QR34_9MYRT|nr:probable pectinesterase/pectinesterase inhibitor 13 [Rhodamnia argentea]